MENEWLRAQIARACGLAVADCEMASFEEQKVLVVERFDRRLSADGKYWLRLPQEDSQALGVPPSLRYEADGGPGIRASLDLLPYAGERIRVVDDLAERSSPPSTPVCLRGAGARRELPGSVAQVDGGVRIGTGHPSLEDAAV